jgi:sugar phosphate isomerase/epimerase
VVAEAFVDRTLTELLTFLAEAAPEVTAVEVGSGGYAPHPHCDRELLLRDAQARRRWTREIEQRGFRVAALNAWGNPLDPDPAVGVRHDRELRETIILAAQLGIDRVVALAGCPPAAHGDRAPHFGAGGWLPYLDGVHERQWAEVGVPYWSALSEFARREHPGLLICIELHPGTLVYNPRTFAQLSELGPNLAANIDPSHFFWQQMDTAAVIAALDGPIGHAHAKDLTLNGPVLAMQGLLDHHWPGPSNEVPWSFATVGKGHDAAWWRQFMNALATTEAKYVTIEHEDPDVPPEAGVAAAAQLLDRIVREPAAVT